MLPGLRVIKCRDRIAGAQQHSRKEMFNKNRTPVWVGESSGNGWLICHEDMWMYWPLLNCGLNTVRMVNWSLHTFLHMNCLFVRDSIFIFNPVWPWTYNPSTSALIMLEHRGVSLVERGTASHVPLDMTGPLHRWPAAATVACTEPWQASIPAWAPHSLKNHWQWVASEQQRLRFL